MRYSVFLQSPFDFEGYWLILGGGLVLAAALAWAAARFWLNKGFRMPWADSRLLMGTRLNRQKARHLKSIDRIAEEFRTGRIDCRQAHQALSLEVRLFVRDVTGEPVECMAVSDLRKAGFPGVTEVVRDMYEPEFAEISKADVEYMIGRSRRLIAQWY